MITGVHAMTQRSSFLALVLALGLCTSAWAKLPAPSDEAKAKAAEAAAKTAHAGKVDAFKLCKAQDKVAAHVQKTNKAKAGKPTATAACADPGPFVAAAPAAAPAATAPAAVPAPAPAKKS
jgi:hypothetical protein